MRNQTSISIAVVTMLACASASASPAQLRKALEDKNYATAGAIVQRAPPGQHRALLTAVAKQNLVPAQWLLAGDYWRAGQTDKAVSWAFLARMGTLLDSSVCLDRRAEQVDSYVAHSYQAIFVRGASDPALEQRALREASAFHQQVIARPMDPEWTCRYWGAIDPQKRQVKTNPTNNNKMLEERKRALQRVLRRGRIDNGIPIQGAIEKDPIKKSLVPSGIPQSWWGTGTK